MALQKTEKRYQEIHNNSGITCFTEVHLNNRLKAMMKPDSKSLTTLESCGNAPQCSPSRVTQEQRLGSKFVLVRMCMRHSIFNMII